MIHTDRMRAFERQMGQRAPQSRQDKSHRLMNLDGWFDQIAKECLTVSYSTR